MERIDCQLEMGSVDGKYWSLSTICLLGRCTQFLLIPIDYSKNQNNLSTIFYANSSCNFTLRFVFYCSSILQCRCHLCLVARQIGHIQIISININEVPSAWLFILWLQASNFVLQTPTDNFVFLDFYTDFY